MMSRPLTAVIRRMVLGCGLLSLAGAGQLAAADTGPGASTETGWLRQQRGERLFLSLSPDGRYQAVREKDRADGLISAQRDTGTFTVAAGRIILTRSQAAARACPD